VCDQEISKRGAHSPRWAAEPENKISSYACKWIFFNLRQVGFSMGNDDWKYEKWLYI
jgi:hypothetical protein